MNRVAFRRYSMSGWQWNFMVGHRKGFYNLHVSSGINVARTLVWMCWFTTQYKDISLKGKCIYKLCIGVCKINYIFVFVKGRLEIFNARTVFKNKIEPNSVSPFKNQNTYHLINYLIQIVRYALPNQTSTAQNCSILRPQHVFILGSEATLQDGVGEKV